LSTAQIYNFFTAPGPNPWKVVWIVEDLELPYELESFSFENVKRKPFIDINPNGRVPGTYLPPISAIPDVSANHSLSLAIHDPNTDLTLWESGAIIQYSLPNTTPTTR
jgi:glutathione S-transferase